VTRLGVRVKRKVGGATSPSGLFLPGCAVGRFVSSLAKEKLLSIWLRGAGEDGFVILEREADGQLNIARTTASEERVLIGDIGGHRHREETLAMAVGRVDPVIVPRNVEAR
jgi:hypothetical protein